MAYKCLFNVITKTIGIYKRHIKDILIFFISSYLFVAIDSIIRGSNITVIVFPSNKHNVIKG